jgi:DNA-binding NtrC family response regulator
VGSTVATVHSEALAGTGRAARCQLVVVEGPDLGRAVPVDDKAIIVGTDAACDLVLRDDRASGKHLQIEREGGRFRIRDLGSTNGTLYEGSAVGEALVAAGATFKIGRSYLRVQPVAQALEVPASQSRRFGDLVGESLVLRELFAVLELAAASDVTVLIEGETGTGKQLAAQAIHDTSPRRRGPFVALDCGSLPENLLESELFGHMRGAFTGALQNREGAFVRAHGGTLFLDELGGVSPAVQARLLRAIEERKVRPVGADEERGFDVRLIAAAQVDLSTLVADGSFRPDLYYRLSVVRVVLPPLRARREDIAPIVGALLRHRGLDPGNIRGPNLDALMAHHWPGNVRELRNVIDRAIALSPGARCFEELRISFSPITGAEPLAVRTDLPYGDAKQALLTAFEQKYLADVLARCQGNISAAAREAGVDRKHLRTLLRRHGLVAGPDDDES